MIGRAVASAAAVFDLRLVLLAGSVPATFGQPLLEAAGRELDQRSRIAFLRSMPDRARPLVQLGLDDARSGVGADRRRRPRQAGAAAGAADEVAGGMRLDPGALARSPRAVLAPPGAVADGRCVSCAGRPVAAWWRRPPFLPCRAPTTSASACSRSTATPPPHRRPTTSCATSGGAATGRHVTAAAFRSTTFRGTAGDFHAADLLADGRAACRRLRSRRRRPLVLGSRQQRRRRRRRRLPAGRHRRRQAAQRGRCRARRAGGDVLVRRGRARRRPPVRRPSPAMSAPRCAGSVGTSPRRWRSSASPTRRCTTAR